MSYGLVALLTFRGLKLSTTSDSETHICDNTDSVLLLKFGKGTLAASMPETIMKTPPIKYIENFTTKN